jgi:hypothetical protein
MLQAEAFIVNCAIIAMLVLSVVRLVMIDFNSLKSDLRKRRKRR